MPKSDRSRPPKRIRSVDRLRREVWAWRVDGQTVAFVPTMGALHDGHLSLVKLAKARADRVVVSIFVNPTQFAPGEDFEAYPRDLEADVGILSAIGVDLIYCPDQDSMYHADHSTRVIVDHVGDGLETDFRPTFFHGVALVVTKLLNRVQPDIAVFGEKDFQQLTVLRRLVRDLDLPVQVLGGPIARDEEGLALSSRNRYFSKDHLITARCLNTAMFEAKSQLEAGEPIGPTLSQTRDALLNAGFSDVDYVTLANAQTLEPLTQGPIRKEMRLLLAAHCHGVRLIDNCAVSPPA